MVYILYDKNIFGPVTFDAPSWFSTTVLSDKQKNQENKQ